MKRRKTITKKQIIQPNHSSDTWSLFLCCKSINKLYYLLLFMLLLSYNLSGQDWTERMKIGRDVEAFARMEGPDTVRIVLRKHTLFSRFINNTPVLYLEFKNNDSIALEGQLIKRYIVEEDSFFNHSNDDYGLFMNKDRVYYSYAVFFVEPRYLEVLSSLELSRAYISTEKGFERIWRLDKYFLRRIWSNFVWSRNNVEYKL